MLLRKQLNAVGLLLTLLILQPACSKSSATPVVPDEAMYPVTGTVTVNGKPSSGVRVVFSGIGRDSSTYQGAESYTDDSGRYKLTIFTTKEGIPAGKYEVRFSWPESPNEDMRELEVDRLKGKYNNPTKPAFVIEVKSGDNQLPPFALK